MLVLRRQGPRQISYEYEDRTNGAYGSQLHGGHKSDRDDILREGRWLDTLDRRRDKQKHDSSSNSNKHHDCHWYHPYRRSDRGYFPYEFKKAKPPTFDGEMKKT